MRLDSEIMALRLGVLKFVHLNLGVLPWLVVSPSRKAFVCEARAVAATLLRLEGLSYRRVAEALGMRSHSSAYELIETHRTRPTVLDAVERWQRDGSAIADREAFGNLNNRESGRFADAGEKVGGGAC